MSKTARWLDLIAFLLQHRYPVTREQIFESVRGYMEDPDTADTTARESARRKFERDKDELRNLGVAIETMEHGSGAGDEPQQGYRLLPQHFYLPYFELSRPGAAPTRPYPGLSRFELTADELGILDRATQRLAEREELPLAAAAVSLRRKLAFDLPLEPEIVARVLAVPLAAEGRQALAVLQEAVADHAAVSCHYYSIRRDAADRRQIEPYGLFFQRGYWYCVAHARDREALRVFRVDRMSQAKRLPGKTPHFTVPETFDIRNHLGRQPWELGEDAPTSVRVRFAFPDSRTVQQLDVGEVVAALLDDGGATLDFMVRDRDPFLRFLLSYGSQVAVEQPPDVAQELADLRTGVARRYE